MFNLKWYIFSIIYSYCVVHFAHDQAHIIHHHHYHIQYVHPTHKNHDQTLEIRLKSPSGRDRHPDGETTRENK